MSTHQIKKVESFSKCKKMSAKTADTEEETLESPTPPKAAPISPDQREDEILEEDEDETEVF